LRRKADARSYSSSCSEAANGDGRVIGEEEEAEEDENEEEIMTGRIADLFVWAF
jgi:hypothetical protein